MNSDTQAPTSSETASRAVGEEGSGGKLGQVAGRADQGKRIVHTIHPDFITGIGRVSAFGAKKYHMRNFLKAPGMAWGRVYDSAVGHLQSFWGGEKLDEESGQPHILMAAWNIMVLHLYSTESAYAAGDDRPATVEYAGKTWEEWEANFKALALGRTSDAQKRGYDQLLRRLCKEQRQHARSASRKGSGRDA